MKCNYIKGKISKDFPPKPHTRDVKEHALRAANGARQCVFSPAFGCKGT